jgi:hypothetical protein
MYNSKSQFGGVFTVECRDANGNLKWAEDFHNLVVNTGLVLINTQVFKAAGYTAAWYLGLVTGPGASNTYAAANTMASHSGWNENTNYTQTSRPLLAFGTPTTADPSVISTSAPAVFTMNASTTVAGAFLTTDNTKSGTTGTLFSVGNFSVGDRSVVNGDTVNVTYTFSADAVP